MRRVHAHTPHWAAHWPSRNRKHMMCMHSYNLLLFLPCLMAFRSFGLAVLFWNVRIRKRGEEVANMYACVCLYASMFLFVYEPRLFFESPPSTGAHMTSNAIRFGSVCPKRSKLHIVDLNRRIRAALTYQDCLYIMYTQSTKQTLRLSMHVCV